MSEITRCGICGTPVGSQFALDKHYCRPPKNEPTRCGICGMEFESLSALAPHNCPLPPPVDENSRCDQQELFDVSINVALLVHAWGQGDDHKIQAAIDLLSEWSRKRGDRLTDQQLRKRIA